jgi:hypothetical protein
MKGKGREENQAILRISRIAADIISTRRDEARALIE